MVGCDDAAGERSPLRVHSHSRRQEQECPPGYSAHRPGGCPAWEKLEHSNERVLYSVTGTGNPTWELQSIRVTKAYAIPEWTAKCLQDFRESGVDAFTIMRIAGHSSITVSQRYIHRTAEAVERAFERLQLSAKGQAAQMMENEGSGSI